MGRVTLNSELKLTPTLVMCYLAARAATLDPRLSYVSGPDCRNMKYEM